MLFWELLIVALLILLNGFFAMSELAIVSSRRARLKQMAEAGDRGAAVAVRLADDPSRFLSTVQVGITLIGILAGAYSGAAFAEPLAAYIGATPHLADLAETIAFGIVVVLTTYLSLIAGELVPKRMALNNAEGISSIVAGPMAMLSRAGAPIVWFLRLSTDTMLRLLRVAPAPSSTVTEEEVKALIAEGTQAGVFEAAEKEMIDGVLRIADRPTRSIMTPRPDIAWLDMNDPLDVVRREIAESGHSRFPVGREEIDELVGIVQTKDLLDRTLRGEPFDLAECAKDALIVHEGTPVLRLLDLFRQAPVHMAVVVDEYGSIEGLVTPTDVLTAIAGDLPEAGDDETPGAIRRGDGSWLIDGRTSLDEVERLLDRGNMAAGHDYSTLAGFVLWQLGHIPEPAEHFDWGGLRFEIVDMDGRRVDKVLVQDLIEHD